jgi:hypothetical protein
LWVIINNMSEEDKKLAIRMKIINNALEDGWTVKKSITHTKTFEFTKCNAKNKIENSGIIIIAKGESVCETIINHIRLLDDIKNNKVNKLKKSISNPI